MTRNFRYVCTAAITLCAIFAAHSVNSGTASAALTSVGRVGVGTKGNTIVVDIIDVRAPVSTHCEVLVATQGNPQVVLWSSHQEVTTHKFVSDPLPNGTYQVTPSCSDAAEWPDAKRHVYGTFTVRIGQTPPPPPGSGSKPTATVTSAISATGTSITYSISKMKSDQFPVRCTVRTLDASTGNSADGGVVSVTNANTFRYQTKTIPPTSYTGEVTCTDTGGDSTTYKTPKLTRKITGTESALKSVQFAGCLGGFAVAAVPVVIGFTFGGPAGAIAAARQWLPVIAPYGGSDVLKACMESVLNVTLKY